VSEYKLKTKTSWAQSLSELQESLEKWGAVNIDVNYPRGARSERSDQEIADRTVTLRYQMNGKDIVLTMDKQSRAVDNLRVLYICIESMRMNERRGISEVMQSAYLQLNAPVLEKDPYDVLGLPRGTAVLVCEAQYKELLKEYHPDRPGGSVEKTKEINDAITKIREGAK
jgi:DnaJ-domain-containing protein 1